MNPAKNNSGVVFVVLHLYDDYGKFMVVGIPRYKISEASGGIYSSVKAFDTSDAAIAIMKAASERQNKRGWERYRRGVCDNRIRDSFGKQVPNIIMDHIQPDLNELGYRGRVECVI